MDNESNLRTAPDVLAFGHSSRVASSFRQIALWKESQAFAAEIGATVARLPRNAETNVLGAQLLRSATSAPANIAEGYGRYSQAAYRNHLSIARGSIFETESWLDLLARRGYITPDLSEKYIDMAQRIGRFLIVRMKSLDDKKTYAIKDETGAYEF